MDGGVSEFAMKGFNLGEGKEHKVDLEEDKLSKEEQVEIKNKVAGALEGNHDSHANVANVHMEVDTESERNSPEFKNDSEDSETGEDDSEAED